MIEMFVPIIMLCLENNPQSCDIFNGNAFETEEGCMVDLYVSGVMWAATQEGTYIAGLSCLPTAFLDEQV